MGLLPATSGALTPPATEQGSPERPRHKDLFLLLALVAVVLAVVPPVASEARRYVFVGAIQFGLIAVAMPALGALGDLFFVGRVARWRIASLIVGGRAGARRSGRGLPLALGKAVLFAAAVAVWRTPPAVDGLVRAPGLVVAEIATFVLVGGALWLELLPSSLGTRLSSPQRIVPATFSMWFIWILAYFLGFSRSSWYPAVHHFGSPLSTTADQEAATGVLWAVAAFAFIPVIFANLMRFLRGDEDVDDELARILDSEPPPP